MAEKEYIEREKVMDALLHEQYGYLCEDAIKSIPAADVRPVVRGRWVKFKPDMPPRRNKCSECGYITNPWLAHVYNFCPNCGARMEES